jgi:hypothetical protein
VILSLNWSDERSFEFCFLGIPHGAPVVAVECRTAGQTDGDRRCFLAGLTEGVKRTHPQCVLVYGGVEHAYWLFPCLPPGPEYTLLPSWTYERDQIRKRDKCTLRNRDQLNLFVKGAQTCIDNTPVSSL